MAAFLPGEWRGIVASDVTTLQSVQRIRRCRHTADASAIRDSLKQYLCSKHGAVPWQTEYVRRTSN